VRERENQVVAAKKRKIIQTVMTMMAQQIFKKVYCVALMEVVIGLTQLKGQV